jgi:hypothetical protein
MPLETLQPFCDQSVDYFWVAFALGSFEDLADKKAHEFGVACFEFRDVLGVVGDPGGENWSETQ